MFDYFDPHTRQVELDRLADDCECAICRQSGADRNGPRVMSAVAAKPGESLVGLIGRAASRNYLPRLRALLGACTSTWHAHFNLASRDDIDFRQLAFAARIPPHEIESRRYRSVPLTANLPGVRYHGATIPAYDLQLRSRRLATSWLVEEPSHCALGHHALATHCPVSGHLFIDRCQRCQARLNWSGLDLAHCTACGFDLASGEPQRVTKRQLGATRTMLHLIHPDPARHEAIVNGLPNLLHAIDRGTLFELGWRLGALLSGAVTGPRIAARKLPVQTRLQILEIGSKVLKSWPESVQSAMQGLSPGRSVIDPKLPTAVRSIAKARNAWPEIRDAIFAAVPGLESSARAGVRSVLPRPANAGEITRTIGVSQRVFERLRASEAFVPVSSTGVEKLHQIYDANQGERLRTLFADRVPLMSASERLGISLHGAEQLCCLGELELLHDDAVIAALKSRHITKSSLEALCSRLERAGIGPEETINTDTLPIRRALRSFGGREKPWGLIVVAMLAGELPFTVDTDRRRRFMDRVSIPTAEIYALTAMGFDVAKYPAFLFTQRINRRDTEELLNVDAPTFARAIENAETPAKAGNTYDRNDVLQLASKTLSVSEALVRWGCDGRTLPKRLKGRRAPVRIGKLGWNRDEAERAMVGRVRVQVRSTALADTNVGKVTAMVVRAPIGAYID